jgi:hypothetical protein
MAVSPAAGPLTLVCEPLINPTIIPPKIPEINPEARGAPEANDIPKHKGKATKKTTIEADKSAKKFSFLNIIFSNISIGFGKKNES